MSTAPPSLPPVVDLDLTEEQQRQVRRIARAYHIDVDAALRLVLDEGFRQSALRELGGQPPLPRLPSRRH